MSQVSRDRGTPSGAATGAIGKRGSASLPSAICPVLIPFAISLGLLAFLVHFAHEKRVRRTVSPVQQRILTLLHSQQACHKDGNSCLRLRVCGCGFTPNSIVSFLGVGPFRGDFPRKAACSSKRSVCATQTLGLQTISVDCREE
ncbi:hypothetical protein Lal_00004991 [Lupinus albus]|nr:hypothetical protein Lal_00004991 [Lupinus albus]